MEQATAPTQAAPAQETQVDPMKMTGEEAVKWVEAQKAKKEAPKKDPYLAESAKPEAAQSTQEAVKEAVAEAKRRLKIDDQEVDEDEVIKVFKERKGHQQAANKILQEGKILRKQAEEFVAMLRDPDKAFDVLQKLGHDPRTLAEKKLLKVLEDEMLDPRDKELRETKKKLQAIEDMERQQKEAAEKQRLETLKSKFAQDYTTQFTQALQESNLPATKTTVAEMAKYIARSAEIGFKMTAQEAAQLVKEDLIEAQRRLIGDTDGEMLIKLLGEEVANKVRKWDTSRLKSPDPQRVAPQDQGERRERRVPHKRMSAKEWREFNRK